nr:uncharacterized protein LOC112292809 [Physcomitrium patens]|eukprot:XP_024397408.1 uncharacterized protein LOC112292809 [Physcomitrella patens]
MSFLTLLYRIAFVTSIHRLSRSLSLLPIVLMQVLRDFLNEIAKKMRYKGLTGFFKGLNTTIMQFGFSSDDLYDQGVCESSFRNGYEAGEDFRSGTVETSPHVIL